VTITQAVSIIAEGVYAGITVSSGNGITVNAGASDVVVLRGLNINGLGGTSGIYFNIGGALYVENCVISRITGVGIRFAGAGNLSVKDSVVRNNEDAGMYITPSSGTATASIDHVRSEGNLHGFVVGSLTKATVRNSVASNNTQSGFLAWRSVTAYAAELNIESCMAANNYFGINADGVNGAVTVRVSNSIITDNAYGFYNQLPGVLESRGNNIVRGNTISDTYGTVTLISGQ
jgi:hypothetical protein